MELALSLGDNIPKPFPFLDHKMVTSSSSSTPNPHKDLGFCKANLGGPLMIFNSTSSSERSSVLVHREEGTMWKKVALEREGSSDPPVQLDLLPFSPVRRHTPPPPPPKLRFPWLSDNLISEPPGKGLQVINRQATTAAEEGEDTAAAMSTSPNSAASSYPRHNQMDFTSMFRRGMRDFLETTKSGGKCNSNSNSSSEMVLLLENRPERSKGGGGGSDEEDMIGLGRKKLRLTKDQSAFLEESFKEHSTLNPIADCTYKKPLLLKVAIQEVQRLLGAIIAEVEISEIVHVQVKMLTSVTLYIKFRSAMSRIQGENLYFGILGYFFFRDNIVLSKQLNLRPRQVEVWFQNRRARTKLKQTEVDCEYLKRCCETMTEENRRLQKELQELRALKSSKPFYMQLPATTLTMCPSCERVASTTTAGAITTTLPAAINVPAAPTTTSGGGSTTNTTLSLF